MQAFELPQLISQKESTGKLYLEFLRTPDLSMGLYQLPAGGTDPQSPHTEDEVYYVVGGRASIKVGDEDRVVQAGSVVYVAKKVEHRFHSIEEELTVLVFTSTGSVQALRRRSIQINPHPQIPEFRTRHARSKVYNFWQEISYGHVCLYRHHLERR